MVPVDSWEQETMENVRKTDLTSVLLLGGQENVLSVMRSLGKRGISVFVSSVRDCWAYKSRYCCGAYPVLNADAVESTWWDLLLNPSSKQTTLKGSLIFACSDEAIEFIAKYKDELEKEYLVEEHDPQLRLATLNKMLTLETATRIGVPTPHYWKVQSIEDVERLKDQFVYPVIVKPFHTHKFLRMFHNRKFFVAEGYKDLLQKVSDVCAHRIPFMITEMIPGPDTLLCSYYTFIDHNNKPLFHFTKRVIRRAPVNQGQGTYQITEWLPETAELGLKFFTESQFRGFGNIEFKRDLRDGNLKVIEVNARLTAALEMLPRSGIDVAYLLYRYHTRQDLPRVEKQKGVVRLWSPVGDIDAFRDLHGMGQLSFLGWLRSVAHKQVFPFFSLSDPLPAIHKHWKQDGNRLKRRLKR